MNIGLMITKNDEEILVDWMNKNLHFFHSLYVLDGSTNNATARICKAYNVRYFHEKDFRLNRFTDQELRGVLYDLITHDWGYDNWITICHADEFFYHDPNKVLVSLPTNFDYVWWYSLHFVPHKQDLKQWDALKSLPVSERYRHFFWNCLGNGEPVKEVRQFKNRKGLEYKTEQGRVIPHGLKSGFSQHRLPCFFHYKIYSLKLSKYIHTKTPKYGAFSRFSDKWSSLKQGFTGIPITVNTVEDLFLDNYPNLYTCTYFGGELDFDWNIGEAYR